MSSARTMLKLMILSDLEAAAEAVDGGEFAAARLCLDGAYAKIEQIQQEGTEGTASKPRQLIIDIK